MQSYAHLIDKQKYVSIFDTRPLTSKQKCSSEAQSKTVTPLKQISLSQQKYPRGHCDDDSSSNLLVSLYDH